MISLLIIFALLLPQREIRTTQSELYSKIVKRHDELVYKKANEINKIEKEAEIFAYMKDKCWVIDVTQLGTEYNAYGFEFAPVKIGDVTVRLFTHFDNKDRTYLGTSYAFFIYKRIPKNSFPNYYDTIMTKYNKSIFSSLRDYFLNKEGFTYSSIRPQNEINDEGNKEVTLEKDGRQLSIQDKDYGIYCLISAYVR